MSKIKVNKIQCKICGDIIESKHVHDYVECSCGACAADGGREYLRRCWDPARGGPEDVFEDLSEIEEDDDDPVLKKTTADIKD